MPEGEREEQETLIRPDDLEVPTAGRGVEGGGGIPSLLHPHTPPLWHLPLHCLALILTSAALVIIIPVYLESVNKAGDAYSALLFVSFFSSLPIILVIQIRYSYFCQLSRLGPPSPIRVVRAGALHGLSLLMMVHALDRKRIVCHAQEPLMGLVVMYMIIIYFFYKGPELTSSKMFALCGILSGLFLAVDFQLNDKYRCHGNRVGAGSQGDNAATSNDDDGGWSLETHSLWTIVYAIALFLFTLGWLMLEREVLAKKCGGLVGERLVSTVSGGGEAEDREILLVGGSSVGVGGGSERWGVYLVWFTLASTLTVTAMAWTDFFTALGKAGSPGNFLRLTSRGWQCHFHFGGECGPTLLYGWTAVALHITFFWLVGRVMALARSMVFTLATTSLALPLQAVWWSLFAVGGPLGVQWHPQVTGELLFSLLGLPVMLACLGFWGHVDRAHTQRTNSLLLT